MVVLVCVCVSGVVGVCVWLCGCEGVLSLCDEAGGGVIGSGVCW